MKIEQILRNKNLRLTKQRKIILELLENCHRPMASSEIYDRLKDELSIDLSTVYRNLNVLEDNDLLLKTTDMDGISYYQLNNKDHKHFITCSNCHKKFIIENCPVHELEAKLMKETGFIINGHNFEFYGICPECQKLLSQD